MYFLKHNAMQYNDGWEMN